MAIKLFVRIADREWYQRLRRLPQFEKVSFCLPSGSPFKALSAGELFLFKPYIPEHLVHYRIVPYDILLPCSLVREAFCKANGASLYLA